MVAFHRRHRLRERMGAELMLHREAFFSLPPCGGGLGWGVVPWGTAVPPLPTPPPDPSPQGGGEEFAARTMKRLRGSPW